MCNQNEWIVREAFLAYRRGDIARVMELVAPDLEWSHLDSGFRADREPEADGGRAELEQVLALGDKVMVVLRTPGAGQDQHGQADGRTYGVLTVSAGVIAALHTCRDRVEAQELAGIS